MNISLRFDQQQFDFDWSVNLNIYILYIFNRQFVSYHLRCILAVIHLVPRKCLGTFKYTRTFEILIKDGNEFIICYFIFFKMGIGHVFLDKYSDKEVLNLMDWNKIDSQI